MDWPIGVLILLVLAVLISIGHKANLDEQKANESFSRTLQSQTEYYQGLLLRGAMPDLDPNEHGYRLVSGETIYMVCENIKDHRNGNSGRLLVTSKALVFETAARSDRFLLTSLTDIKISLDGFTLRKRTGPVRPFFTGANTDLLALIKVISWRFES